jgi:hypothetical protein
MIAASTVGGIKSRTMQRHTGGVILACAAGVLLLGPAAAGAAPVTYDFAAWIENVLPGSSDDRERGFYNDAPFELTVGALTLTATAFELPGEAPSHVYMDGRFNGIIGGMGVCSVLDTNNRCAPSSDDNVSIDGLNQEKLVWQFSQNVRNVTLTLRDSEHFLYNGTDTAGGPRDGDTGRFEYMYGDSPWQSVVTDALGMYTLVLDGSSDLLKFRSVASGFANQFYITSAVVTPVPLPAALLLFLSGLAALGPVARYRR